MTTTRPAPPTARAQPAPAASAAPARRLGAPAPRSARCGQWLPADGRHCHLPARLYPAGWLCTGHSPAAQAGADEPPTSLLEPRR
ncbi:hypothetical protein [Kitasatospora sp. NPDC004272]